MPQHPNYGLGPRIANTQQTDSVAEALAKTLKKNSIYKIPKLTLESKSTPWYKTNGIAAGTLYTDPDGVTRKESYIGDNPKADLNDFVSANDFDGAYDSGYTGTKADFAKLQAADAKGTGWGMEGYGGVALGAGQLGLGVMSYLENQKTAGKQRELLDQQIAQNKYVLANAKGHADSVRAGFSGGFSSQPQGV